MYTTLHIGPHELPEMSEALILHFISLSSSSMEMRFFSHKTLEAIENWMEHIMNSKQYQHHWLLQINEESKVVGAGHLSIDKHWMAEIAVSILDSEQGNGLGKELLSQLIDKAKELHCREIKVCCLPQNRKIINLLKSYGFEMSYVEGDMYGFLSLRD